MKNSSVTLISGHRFLPPNFLSNATTTVTPDNDMPGFLQGYEVLTFFVVMFIILPPIILFIKGHYVNRRRRGYEHV